MPNFSFRRGDSISGVSIIYGAILDAAAFGSFDGDETAELCLEPGFPGEEAGHFYDWVEHGELAGILQSELSGGGIKSDWFMGDRAEITIDADRAKPFGGMLDDLFWDWDITLKSEGGEEIY